MKKISSIMVYILFLSTLSGQGFIKAEYFFDVDPGINNGTTIELGNSSDTANLTASISTTSLSAGFHFLGLRVLHNDGVWSLTESRIFYLSSPPGDNDPDIVAAEYFIDSDPGPGNGTAVLVGPSGATVNFTVTIPSMLPVGFHVLSIRTRDAIGQWGLFETRRFYISPPASPNMPVITEAEYFFDLDPGPGNANPLPVPTPADTINLMAGISVPCLSTGQHFLSIRVKDQSNHWSLFGSDTLTLTSGISASTVTPAGPVTICVSDSVILSADSIPGISYQWLMDGNDISGANSFSYTVHIAGNYSLKTTCNGSFVTSNVVIVNTQPLLTFYFDADGDTYGGLDSTTQACIAPVDFVSNNTDCDDANNTIYPGATEICNGIDDNCDQLIDEGVQTTFYADADADGFGVALTSIQACIQPFGYVVNNTDCDDNNAGINSAVEYFIDADHDTYGSTNTGMVCATTPPPGYSVNSLDCDDSNMNIFPGADEICNGSDDDCDSLIDDDDPSVTGQSSWYVDVDNDGYGNTAILVMACSPPTGYVSNNGDCDDTNMNIHPVNWELCNGIDDDCDDDIDEPFVAYDNPSVEITSEPSEITCATTSVIFTATTSGITLPEDPCPDCGGIQALNGTNIFYKYATLYDWDCCLFGPGITEDPPYLVDGHFTVEYDCNGYGTVIESTGNYAPLFPVGSSYNESFGYSPIPDYKSLVTNPSCCNETGDKIYVQLTEERIFCQFPEPTTFSYQWAVNGINVSTDNPYMASSFLENDLVTCLVTVHSPCGDENFLSNEIEIMINNQPTWYQDNDNDGYGHGEIIVLSCDQPSGYVFQDGDCNDADALINPDISEICNDVDDDCDSVIDEDCGDSDMDDDGILDEDDNCISTPNENQADTDSDGIGDACDNCINQANEDQEDIDCDSVGDACDVCPGGDDYGPCNATSLPPLNELPSYWLCSNNNNSEKILICHEGTTLCVSENAANTHLSHGDFLGPCMSCPQYYQAPISNSEPDDDNMPAFELSPNPATDQITSRLKGDIKEGQLIICDQLGREVLIRQLNPDDNFIQMDLDESRFPSGIYYISVITNGNIQTKRFIVSR